MKLITEQIEPVEILTEEKDGKKSTYIKGVFLQTEITNRNGRMYKYETMEREVGKYNEEFIKRGRALGELGHPEGPTINLDRVSHKIVELLPEVKTSLERLNYQKPLWVRSLRTYLKRVYNQVCLPEVQALLEKEGTTSIVADDFILSTAADIVADPSAPDAFVQGIYEGKEWALVDGAIKEAQLEAVKNVLDNAPSKEELAERKISAFESLLRSL